MALTYQVYFRKYGSDWSYLGETSETEWDLTGYTNLLLYTLYEWSVDTYDTETELTTTGDTWLFITTYGFFYPFPRRSDFGDIDEQVWDWENGEWSDDYDIFSVGGGRYRNSLVILSDKGDIYIGE